MRDGLKALRCATPSTQGGWEKHFRDLAAAAGFGVVVEEEGHGDVFVKEHPAEPGAMLGVLVVGKDFFKRFVNIASSQPDIFKKFLEHTVVHHAGEVFTSGVVYAGMEGMATIIGAEKLGYSAEEIVDLLATGVVMGYLASMSDGFDGYEEYLQKAESIYDAVFWDFLKKEEVLTIISRAREMRSSLQGCTGLGPVRQSQKKKLKIIDCHIHSGGNRKTKSYSADKMLRDLSLSGVDGAVVFAFPEDMYRMQDSPDLRDAANRYVLELCDGKRHLYPFYFVWNDYLIPPDLDRYCGIKWHRHPDEPKYDYADPRCEEFLHLVRERRLPVLFEEEFDATARFIERNPDMNVIIPHMGERNGGTFKMKAFFDNPRVYFDTSTASQFEIGWMFELVGPQRILFGSDVSGTRTPFFNFPWIELLKIQGLGLGKDEMEMVCSGNLLSILGPRRLKRTRASSDAALEEGAGATAILPVLRNGIFFRRQIP